MPTREALRQQAMETVNALDAGWFCDAAGNAVDFSARLQQARKSVTLNDLGDLARAVDSKPTSAPRGRTRRIDVAPVIVAHETTLAGAEALSEGGEKSVCCLVFASAKNPGGGFLRGSDAQEESLARATGLVACLEAMPALYEANRACGTALYTDLAIHARATPVIRDDRGTFLSRPWPLSMIVAPAPNRAAVMQNEPERVRDLPAVFERRVTGVLELARQKEERRLALGAWGCGVFGWEPRQVAAMFAKALAAPVFADAFDAVRFSVFDPSRGPAFQAFAERFPAR